MVTLELTPDTLVEGISMPKSSADPMYPYDAGSKNSVDAKIRYFKHISVSSAHAYKNVVTCSNKSKDCIGALCRYKEDRTAKCQSTLTKSAGA